MYTCCLKVTRLSLSSVLFRSHVWKISGISVNSKCKDIEGDFNDEFAYFPLSIQQPLLNYWLIYALRTAIHLQLFETLSKHESMSVQQIYKESSVLAFDNPLDSQSHMIYQILRYLSSFGFTSETKKYHFTHNHKSLQFLNGSENYHILLRFTNPFLCPIRSNFHQSFVSNDIPSAVELLSQPKQTYFEHLDNNPMEFEHFLQSMDSVHQRHPELISFTDMIDFDIIVDIGCGKTLDILMQFLAEEEQMQRKHFLAFDLPSVVKQIDVQCESKANIDRLQIIEGDFFNLEDLMKIYQKIKNININDRNRNKCCFILKRILCKWNDNHCKNILRNIRRVISAMEGKHSVFICDTLISDELNSAIDLPHKMMDLENFMLFGIKERSLSEFDVLFEKCGFKRISHPQRVGVLHMVQIIPI